MPPIDSAKLGVCGSLLLRAPLGTGTQGQGSAFVQTKAGAGNPQHKLTCILCKTAPDFQTELQAGVSISSLLNQI